LNDALTGAKIDRTDSSAEVRVYDFSSFGGIALIELRLTTEDRKHLQEIVDRRMRPTKRQKAEALLRLGSGETPARVSMQVGIKKEDLESLVRLVKEQGLKGIGLGCLGRTRSGAAQPRRCATIEKTPGVCGGAARVGGTRIPVWQLVEARNLGVSEAQLLIDYPRLRAVNLVDAWAYAENHPDEIATQIQQNEVA
jgi:uncharacterized protein (DUF433 family)